MLRYALRRALWIPPALVLTTILFFGLIAHLARQGAASDSQRTALPLFVNPKPRDVRALSTLALDNLTNDQDVPEAERLLVRLGGAALPYVLPHLDALGPESRGRLAMALHPVAQRMGLATTTAFSSPENAVAFWTRFWEERSVDFKPAVVRRAVRRQAMHGSLARRAALVELDTYALGGLMEALEPVRTPDDVARAHRLLDVAAHVTGRDPCVHPDMDPASADRCIVRWRDWWLVSHADFGVLSGPDRISAILTETQYGKWALQALTLQLGVGPDGVTVLERIRSSGPRTVALAILALVLAYGVAFPLGLLGAQWQGGLRDNLTSLGLLGLLAWPAPALAVTLAHLANGSFALVASVIAIAAGLVTVPARHQRLAAIDDMGRDWIRHGRACGIHPARLLFVHVGRPAATLGLALVALDFPLAMSAVCVAEHAFGLDGLGPHLVRAVLQRDVAFLMAFGLAATALHALLLLASDILTGWLDPRLNRSIHGEHAWP